jgi:uncharacterized protein YbbC (DUF1343 family)
MLQAIMLLYPENFEYKEPPYEYEYDRLPMDLILGDIKLREALELGEPLAALENSWQDDLDEFNKLRNELYLYN